MIDDRAELVRWDTRREVAERSGDGGAGGHDAVAARSCVSRFHAGVQALIK